MRYRDASGRLVACVQRLQQLAQAAPHPLGGLLVDQVEMEEQVQALAVLADDARALLSDTPDGQACAPHPPPV